MSVVDYRIEGRVAVLTLDNPPVNALSHALRVGIADGLEQAGGDDAVAAVVIAGKNHSFIAGADIREFGTRWQGHEHLQLHCC